MGDVDNTPRFSPLPLSMRIERPIDSPAPDDGHDSVECPRPCQVTPVSGGPLRLLPPDTVPSAPLKIGLVSADREQPSAPTLFHFGSVPAAMEPIQQAASDLSNGNERAPCDEWCLKNSRLAWSSPNLSPTQPGLWSLPPAPNWMRRPSRDCSAWGRPPSSSRERRATRAARPSPNWKQNSITVFAW